MIKSVVYFSEERNTFLHDDDKHSLHWLAMDSSSSEVV